MTSTAAALLVAGQSSGGRGGVVVHSFVDFTARDDGEKDGVTVYWNVEAHDMIDGNLSRPTRADRDSEMGSN